MSELGAVVVGGGTAGLAAAWHLGRAGVAAVVLERDRIGETWRSQRWDSFVLNTPAWYSRMPGDPEPAPGERDSFAPASALVERLERYAAQHGIRVRTGTTVVRVVAGGGPEDGLVVSADGPEGREDLPVPSVVVASGILNVPRVPAIARSLPSGIRQLTAASYRRAADLPPGAVLVVGSAQSGVQIAEDLVADGRVVYLCTSSVGRSPRRYRGRDMFEWLAQAGFFDRTPDQLPEPRTRFPANPQVSGVGPLGHTVSLQSLAGLGVTLLGRPREVTGDRLLLDDTLGANIALGDRVSADLKRLADDFIAATGPTSAPVEPDPADEPHPDPASVHSPAELDLERAGIGAVVWATGFRGDFSYLPRAVVDYEGQPVHERGVTTLAGLFLVGFPWLTKQKSGIINGVGEDAERIAGLVARRIAADVPR